MKVEESTSAGVAGDLAVLGALLLGQGRYAEAEEVLLQSLAIWRHHFGQEHYEIAVVQNNLAAVYTALGDLQQAERTYNAALQIKRGILGADHPEVTYLQRQLERLRP
jgi:tetratricopeptide (TPR) repeat protein